MRTTRARPSRRLRVAAPICAILAMVGHPTRAVAATVLLDAYDAAGDPIPYSEFIATLEAEGWRNDATYALADGTIVAFQPLYESGGRAAFDVTGSPVGLSLAWPTASAGYSTLFLDNGGAGFASGTVNFSYRAALDYRAKLTDALARRPAFVPTPGFTAAEQEADTLLAAAAAAATESERGALGQQALDALARSLERLLYDYGLQRARATPATYWWGVTVDRINNYQEVVASIADLAEGAAGQAYVRIVFDEGVPATSYDAIVGAAVSAGLVVVGEILDSSAMSRYTLAGWQARVTEYVDHFSAIAVWEIGNEVNGEWLGPEVRERLEYAAAYVKAADPSDRTLLTLYWQMGTAGDAAHSVFQWIDDNVTAALQSNVDVVGLSAWIGDAPLGLAHDEVFERISALFPGKAVVMGELGYWSPGTSKYWWWRSKERPETSVRRALAQHMYVANLGFDYGLGGNFWWFYYGEMRQKTPLWFDVNDAYRSIYDCVDADGDTHCDFLDNCPADANADQADADADGVGDTCDVTCQGGATLAPRKLKLRLKAGAQDQLVLQASFASTASLDPAATGVAVLVTSAGAPLLSAVLGGPGAPAQFTESNGRFRYRDRFGLAGGVVKADLKPNNHVPGAYTVNLSAQRASLEGIVEPDLRVLLDFATDCAETHADAIYCTWRRVGEDLRCE